MFTSLSKNLLGLSLSVFAFFSVSSFAAHGSQGGVIHFVGQIVEPPCEVSSEQGRLEMSCERDGRIQRHRFSPQRVSSATQYFQQIASVKMQYLNERKNLAIMSIEYR
ncbi:hypothetical protein C3432_07405 [Citrobacter amalonaticus]|uniref:Type 1 fimbrial protein n=1 Tax=Citrobacter amalonaticus TaxID=35703 RepID=A0A2S4RYI9_CITAM|nr:type 1 fimbrial protein [Citrobacter amalonaticus]POT57764.1 hypothetical protein C3432_07405 [Citrobacter amalonaticus]POT76709.1 hypothetical protein C3436_04415 [Citrobacter amalonaticus]POU65788.1 hypothetical protein C3430_10830 [Citrobacter amalonaticus]POV05945.1 hypothetical protein C3424_11715 [Citrobacter amalonaticus]